MKVRQWWFSGLAWVRGWWIAPGVVVGLLACVSAQAEVSHLSIGVQFGLGYLPVYVADQAGFINAELAKEGLPAIPVDIHNFTGAPDISDGLLSGSLDIGSGGFTAMMISNEKTAKGGARATKGIAALSAMPYDLFSNDSNIKTLADLSDKDRIGLTAIKVSMPAVLLKMASDKEFGQQDRFDGITVAIAQPDGASALITKNGLVDGYVFAAPFIQQMRDKPGVHRVWSSNDVFGTPTTALSAWTNVAFREANPKTYAAFFAALHDADAYIAAHRNEAAAIYLKAEQSKLPIGLIEECLADPAMAYDTAPSNSAALSSFLVKIGMLKAAPATWQAMFFPEIAGEKGS